jgi:hypothetical protein
MNKGELKKKINKLMNSKKQMEEKLAETQLKAGSSPVGLVPGPFSALYRSKKGTGTSPTTISSSEEKKSL